MSQSTTTTAESSATQLEGFCPICPAVEEVSGQLEQLGYRLVFSLPLQAERDHLPELPAQYHYRHASGAEAAFLAGQDSPLHTGVLSLPHHESRFWLSRGGEAVAFQSALSALALRLSVQWREESDDDEADETEKVA